MPYILRDRAINSYRHINIYLIILFTDIDNQNLPALNYQCHLCGVIIVGFCFCSCCYYPLLRKSSLRTDAFRDGTGGDN